jgi:hypothetical protein
VADLYYNSWRFFGANILVGLVLLAIVLAAVGSPWALALLPVSAVPAAGLMRMATTLVRAGHADFSDVTEVIRRPWMALAFGSAQALVGLVLVVDMQLGAAVGPGLGPLLTVTALYGLIVAWTYSAIAWPLLVDPERDGDPIPARLRLAGLILVAHPVRVGGFLLLVGVFLGISAIAIAPFLTFTLALAWLVVARFVLPVADRIEGRRTATVQG